MSPDAEDEQATQQCPECGICLGKTELHAHLRWDHNRSETHADGVVSGLFDEPTVHSETWKSHGHTLGVDWDGDEGERFVCVSCHRTSSVPTDFDDKGCM